MVCARQAQSLRTRLAAGQVQLAAQRLDLLRLAEAAGSAELRAQEAAAWSAICAAAPACGQVAERRQGGGGGRQRRRRLRAARRAAEAGERQGAQEVLPPSERAQELEMIETQCTAVCFATRLQGMAAQVGRLHGLVQAVAGRAAKVVRQRDAACARAAALEVATEAAVRAAAGSGARCAEPRAAAAAAEERVAATTPQLLGLQAAAFVHQKQLEVCAAERDILHAQLCAAREAAALRAAQSDDRAAALRARAAAAEERAEEMGLRLAEQEAAAADQVAALAGQMRADADAHEEALGVLGRRITELEQEAALRPAPALLPGIESRDRRFVEEDEEVLRDRMERDRMLQGRLVGAGQRGDDGGWQPTGSAPLPPRTTPLRQGAAPLPPRVPQQALKQLRAQLKALGAEERQGRKETVTGQKAARRELWREQRGSLARVALGQLQAEGRDELTDEEEHQRVRLAAAMRSQLARHTVVSSADGKRWGDLMGTRLGQLRTLKELLASGGLDGASVDPATVLRLARGQGSPADSAAERAGETILVVALRNGVADGLLVAHVFTEVSDAEAVQIGAELGLLTKEDKDRRNAYWPPELRRDPLPARIRRLVLVAGVATRRTDSCRGLGQRLHEELWHRLPPAVTHSVLQPATKGGEEPALYERDRDEDGESVRVTNPALVGVYQWRWGYRLLLQDDREKEKRAPIAPMLSRAPELVLGLLRRGPEGADDDIAETLDGIVDEVADKTEVVAGDVESAMVLLGCRPLPLFAGMQLRDCSPATA